MENPIHRPLPRTSPNKHINTSTISFPRVFVLWFQFCCLILAIAKPLDNLFGAATKASRLVLTPYCVSTWDVQKMTEQNISVLTLTIPINRSKPITISEFLFFYIYISHVLFLFLYICHKNKFSLLPSLYFNHGLLISVLYNQA